MKRRHGVYRRRERYWGDFRAYADVGGRREPLVPEGAKLGTKSAKLATILYGRRVEHYEALRQNCIVTGIAEHATIAAYSEYHLEKLRQGAATDPTARPRLSTIARYARALANVIDRLGADAFLTEITPERLTRYIEERRRESITGATIRQELVALSRLMKRALSEHRATTNPVALCVDRPRISRPEAVWLERDEADRLLKAAAELDTEPARPGCSKPIPFLKPLLATFLLTGGRKSEVLGLEVRDVDFAEGHIRLRDNSWRRLKRGGERAVPLWPQLRSILKDYLDAAPRSISGLLFPSPKDGRPVRDFRIALAKACEKAEIEKHVTPHTLRHSYTAARLRTFHTGPQGQPVQVSAYYVARELGHSSATMIERVYGHVLASGSFEPEVRYESAKTAAAVEAKA